MADLKEQLAAIRSLVPKAETSDANHRWKNSRDRSKASSNSDVSLLYKCLDRLPYFAHIESFDASRGFGFISTGTTRRNLFFHIKGQLRKGGDQVFDDLSNREIIYLIGSSEKDGRNCAVQWVLVDTISWDTFLVPQNQSSLNEIRLKWFEKQDLTYILNLLRPHWYIKKFKNGMPPADLNDPILEQALIEHLRVLSVEEWRQYKVFDAIHSGLFSFLKKWDFTSEAHVPENLLIAFLPSQLFVFGPPRHNWLNILSNEFKPKLFEWAIRSSLDIVEAQKWEADLHQDFPWASRVASALLNSNWQPSAVGIRWIKRLVLSKDLSLSSIQDRLKNNPDEWIIWLDCMPNDAKLGLLVEQMSSAAEIAEFVAARKDPELERLAIRHYTLALDIESDGERIWEIGTATHQGKALRFSHHDSTTGLPETLSILQQDIGRSSLIVGHNILAWDWPILSPLLPESRNIVFWDTLLVAFMLAPWMASHALGGTHQADEDAADAFHHFESQLEVIGGSISVQLLTGEINSTAKLMQVIGESLQSMQWQPPSLPVDLTLLRKGWRSSQILIINRPWLARFNWTPNVAVVSADQQETLDTAYLALEGLQGDSLVPDLASDPCAVALQSVLRKATASNISVRYSMLPLWIREYARLRDPIRAALASVDAGRYAIVVAPYPTRAAWYTQIQADRYVFVDPPEAVFVADPGWLRASELPPQAQQRLLLSGDAPRSGSQYRLGIGEHPTIELWISLDPVARRLSRSGKCFRTLKTVDSRRDEKLSIFTTAGKLHKLPKLLARAETTLHPGTQDQASYWKGVISGLHTIAANRVKSGTVFILLIGSSVSTELVALIEQCLCEVSMAVPYADHQSRRDRLLKAATVPGACLVDLLDTWYDWQALAASAAVVLCPVLECVPLADWYATGARDSTSQDTAPAGVALPDELDNERDEIVSPPDDLEIDGDEPPLSDSMLVKSSDIAACTLELVKTNLGIWLNQVGIATSSRPCFVLDPRIPSWNREMRQEFEYLEGKEHRLTREYENALDRILEPLAVTRESAPSDYESMRAFLEKFWNVGKTRGGPGWIADFRETQRPAIEAIRDRAADVLVTLPTGEGKSVLFQVPALCKGLRTRRLSIVISPLRALMRDQVQQLWQKRLHQSVDYLTADRPFHELDEVYQGVLDHRIVLLYVAPERFRSRRFIDIVGQRFESDGAFEYVIVDEAHCVSQWGYEFRPDYFFALNWICQKYRSPQFTEKTPLLLLSATVTAANREHLSELIRGRPNLPGGRYLEFKARPDQYFHPIRSHIEIRPAAVPGRINTRPKADWPIGPRFDIILNLIHEAQQNQSRTRQHSGLIIFVSRRDHAEELSMLISKQVPVPVDYFHAGMDPESREEVYQHFREGSLGVLVATKAFGMGMDIPDIHWAVHLAPPAFLEDYLQEVGRIGRGEQERKDAQLDRLTATLLYSAEDFETNRIFIQRSRIELRQVADLYAAIVEHAKLTADGAWVAMMPDAGFATFNTAAKRRAGCLQARRVLYWLERLERVEILTMMPGLLPVRLDFVQINKIAASESGSIADVAKLLSTICSPQPVATVKAPTENHLPESRDQSILDRIIEGLSSFVGLLLGTKRRTESQSTTATSVPLLTQHPADIEDAIINLDHIWRDTSLGHIDDVLATIAELEERKALEVTRKIAFSPRLNAHAKLSEVDQLFDKLREVTLEIIRGLTRDTQYVIDFDVLAESLPATQTGADLADIRIPFERAVCYLLRSAGVSIRERLQDGERELLATLGRGQQDKVAGRVKSAVEGARALWKEFIPRLDDAEGVIEFSTLLQATRRHAVQQRFRENDLRRNLGLLGALKLVSVSERLVPMSYVLSVHQHEGTLDEHDHPDVWTELSKVNRLTELRGDALEIFVHLPADARDQFIEGYFKQSNPDEMEAFLTEQLGEIDDPKAGAFIEEKREQLQAKAIEKFLEPFTVNPEEPNQWLAISHPFNRNLMVNAGPGSGKTTVLTARLAHLIRYQHIPPEEILVLAFNRAVIFEIRERIRALFSKLGYGAYVRRLDVSTFHSYATRHLKRLERLLKNTDDWDKDRATLLHRFADHLENDLVFRSTVAGGLRTILVDEFQDVNKEIYRIIKLLSSANSRQTSSRQTSVMVIGDDDQDILAWNRLGESSDIYFRRFIQDYSLSDRDLLALSVNFRSGPLIVERTQEFLEQFCNNQEGMFERVKTCRLRAANQAKQATVNGIVDDQVDFDSFIERIKRNPALNLSTTVGTVAILCRTNHEVATAYHALRPVCPKLVIQNNVSYPISRLRHIGLWIDLLKADLKSYGDRPLSEPIFERMQADYKKNIIPEITMPRDEDVKPRQLWELCFREASYPYLTHLIEFIESIDSDDIVRLLGRAATNYLPPVISTIHKVKGLEFDTVIILPSTSRFSANSRNSAAEEVRLYYVAMTRSKKRLFYHIGPRENAWLNVEQYSGNEGTGKILEGKPEEVGISWAWETMRFNLNAEETLNYIQQKVRVGDRLLVAGYDQKSLFHRDDLRNLKQIGRIASQLGIGSDKSQLNVSAVLRCFYNNQQFFGGQTALSVQRQGWGLVVLASGILR